MQQIYEKVKSVTKQLKILKLQIKPIINLYLLLAEDGTKYIYISIMLNGNLRLVPFIAIDSFLLFNILSTFCRPSRENTDTSNIRYHYSFKEFLKCIKVALVQKNNHQQLTCRMQTIYLEMFV